MFRLKWLGVFTFIGGLLEVISWVCVGFGGNEYGSLTYYISTGSGLLGGIFFLFTLIGLYLTHGGAKSWFNNLCIFIGFIGASLFTGLNWVRMFVEPYVHNNAPKLLTDSLEAPLSIGFSLSFTLFALGVVLMSILMLSKKKFPKYIGVLLLIGPIFDLLPFNTIGVGQLIFGISLVILGWLFCKRDASLIE